MASGPLHPGPSYFGCYGPDARAPVAGKNFVRHGCSHLPTIAIVFVEKIGFVSHIPPRVTDAAVVAAITATSRPKTFSHPVLRNEPNFLPLQLGARQRKRGAECKRPTQALAR